MPGGIYIDFRRQETAKDRLAIDWSFPVYKPEVKTSDTAGRTSTAPVKAALPREQAIAEIRAEDRRPLLVVRECGHCKGTDDALLSRRLDNEKTLVYAQWFRCVKLPNHVLGEKHPFRNLFDGEHPPHLFLCRYDGTGVVSLDGQQTQSDLWRAMEDLIAQEYTEKPKPAVREFMRILDGYDAIDSIEQEKRRQYEEELDEHGAKSSKARRLAKQLEKLEARRAELEAREQDVLDLGLLPMPEEPDDEGDESPDAVAAGKPRRR